MSDRARIESAFEAALERDEPGRSGFLADLRDSEPEVAAEVEELLAAHDVRRGILDEMRPTPAPRPMYDRRIGAYRVVRELGRGGMGVVYLAERDDGQFRRRVAVKLLRSTPDADELQQRFLAERQILALLDHPNIAQLLDGGVTDGRLPYLVMEYVEGLPVTQYCDRHRLTIPERLRLFQAVCAAVNHAHRNLVLHRDLKPGNILVTANGQVKLLDFGIAKLLNPGLNAVAAPVTWTSHRVLTPEYASPEQLRGEPLSTTSDIYALGVILFELLTGRRPHETISGSQQPLAIRICEEEPQRPSAAWTRSDLAAQDAARQAAAIAAARATSPHHLRSALRGDLDAIVLMALRKEPGRRYGSADLLAQDVQRHLEGLPVLAHKGSRAYYIRKFVRRHWLPVATAAVMLVSLVTGAGVALHQSAAARDESERAQRALQEAEEITAYLVSMFEANDPAQSRGQEATARDLLRRGLQRAEQLGGQPLVQARMLDVIGRVYQSMADYAQARTVLARALSIRDAQLGPDHLEVAQTQSHLAEAFRYLSQYAEAETAARRALDIRVRALGPKHPDVATSMLQVATMAVYRSDVPRSIALTRQAIAIREAAFGPQDSSVATALISLGARLSRLGEYQEAERYIRRAIAINRSAGTETAHLADAIINLAYLLEDVPGRAAEAEPLLREALRMRRTTLGVDHPLSNFALGDLVLHLTSQKRYREALPLAREHLETAKRLFGANDARIPDIAMTYAHVLAGVGQRGEAIQMARTLLVQRERVFGREHVSYANGLYGLALLLDEDGEAAEAEPLMRQVIAIRTRASGGESGIAAVSYAVLASIQMHRGRYADAAESVTLALGMLQRLGVDPIHKDYQTALRVAAEVSDRLGRKEESARYRQAIVN